VTTAHQGTLESLDPGQPAKAYLTDGVRMSLPDQRATEGANILQFGELRLTLGDEDYGPFRPRGRDEREFTLAELWKYRNAPPNNIKASFLVSEFHGRLVRLLSIIVLPFLAVSLALGRQRSERFYGIAVGGGLLFAYHELLKFGERGVAHGPIEPWLGLWTPLVVFAAGSALLFYRTAFLAGQPLGVRFLDVLSDRISAFAAHQASVWK
jgi:lipopolysaccharide export system permease protein